MSLEVADVNGTKVYILVFRNNIGKNLFQGSLSTQYTKKRRIEEKAHKQQLKLALVIKDPVTKKIKVEHCVASFARSSDLEKFEKDLDMAMQTLKNQAPSAGKKAEETKKD